MNSSGPSDRDTVDRLAEEFAERHRRGERPSASEYADRYPEHAEQIRDLFPALALIERAKPDSAEPTADHAGGGNAEGRHLERLGDFRILAEVGRGGMGIVYEAEQESLGRRVALKVLPGHALLDPRQLVRFKREARAAARLHHTNIVPVFGVGEQDGLHYYVMQFIRGQSLDSVLEELRRLRQSQPPVAGARLVVADDRRGSEGSNRDEATAVARSLLTGQFAPHQPDPSAVGDRPITDEPSPQPERLAPGQPQHPTAATPSAVGDSPVVVHASGRADLSSLSSSRHGYWQGVARVGVQVAEALAYAHGQVILHRDIKPSNLLLDARGNVWVADFGLAKSGEGEDLTHTGDVVGTLRYLAPERLEGQSDARGDVFSLGLTLYELLTLRPAFDATDRERLIRQVTDCEPPRPRLVEPGVPRDLETIVLKAIARERTNRYATAEGLAEDLQRFVEGRPIRARRVSATERFGRWCKRNPVVAGLTAAVFALLVVVAAVASVGYVQTRLALSREGEQREAAVAAEKAMRRQWYAATINLMQQAWDTGQMGRLRDLLLETEAYPDRGFEWYYWQRLCHLEERTFIGHRAGLLSVSWSPNGKLLATGSVDGTARVWRISDGRDLLVLRGHMGYVRSVSWSVDGTRLATASEDGTVKVWDATDGHKLFELTGHAAPVYSVAWSPKGTWLATGSEDGTALVWPSTGGPELRTFRGPCSAVSSMGFSPCGVWSVSWSEDEKRLATGSCDGTVRIWHVGGGREPVELVKCRRGVNCVSLSPDGRRLATTSWDDTARVWDASDGRESLVLSGPPSRMSCVSWSGDGKRLAAVTGDGTAKVWDADSGKEILILRGHTGPIGYSAWSPGLISSVSWSPDGTRLATASGDGTAKVWDAAGGLESLTLRGHTGPITYQGWNPTLVSSVAWSPDGRRLATGGHDGVAKIWDATDGQEQVSVERLGGEVWFVCWSPDGNRLATASDDGIVKILDAVSGQQSLKLEGHRKTVYSVAWSPDRTRLATGGVDGTVRLWDAASGRERRTPMTGHASGVWSVSWSPDGKRLATCSTDRTARIWDAESGRELLIFERHRSPVLFVSWSPDGHRLATGNRDGTAKVWDAASGHELLTLEGHTGAVWSPRWSPDGRRLATASEDGTAKVWDLASGRELLTLKGHRSALSSVAWSPDGQRLATASHDGSVKIWDAASAESVEGWARQESDVRELLARNTYSGPAARGFIQTWLLLLPLHLVQGETGEEGLDRHQLPGEGQLRPRPGEPVRVGGRKFVWREYRSPGPFVKFNAVLRQVSEQSVVYAVCYVESDHDRDGLWVQAGADNQSKLYLNGRQIYQCRLSNRPLWSLDTVGPVALKQGVNVLVLKVVNDVGAWEGCVRLVDDAGLPVQGIRVRLTP
jgi:WD40 repeat protein/serine/threonine protein kinase